MRRAKNKLGLAETEVSRLGGWRCWTSGVPIDVDVLDGVRRRITTMWPHLSELQRRTLLGVEARKLGWGGVSAVAELDNPPTVTAPFRGMQACGGEGPGAGISVGRTG